MHSTFLLYLELRDHDCRSQTENSSKHKFIFSTAEKFEVLPVIAYKYIYHLIPNNLISIRNL